MPRRRPFSFNVKEICQEECLTSLYRGYKCEEETGDFIYTYDNIPIRKIVVANINDETNHKQLKEKFAIYGKIVDCNLKKKSLTKSYAFITFKESPSAHSAIYDGCNKNICIDGMYLRVLPANSWHQPDKNEYTVNISRKVIENGYFSNDASPISKLNEHCLMHIFGFLPIRDRVRIERVCRYWQIISIQSLYKCPQFNSILNLDNWRYIKNVPTFYKILEKFGLHITKVNLSGSAKFGWGNSTLIAIATLCPNIEEIDLSNFPFLASGIKALAKNCTKIKQIVLGRSTLELVCDKIKHIDYNKELSAWFSKNRNIQYLHLKDRGMITTDLCLKHLSTKHITHIVLTGQNCSLFIRIISKIQNLFSLDMMECENVNMLLQAQDFQLNAKNLERLTIQDCFLIDQLIITDFLKSSNLTNLKYLDLQNMCIEDECLFTLGEKCNQLIHLNISGSKLSNRSLSWIITSLTKLEHLYMDSIHYVTNEIFICGMPNLKTLSCNHCGNIQDKGLIQFIKNSEKLEKLDVRYCHITEELISAAFESTKHRKNKLLIKSEITCMNNFMGAEEYLKNLIGIQFMGVKRHECAFDVYEDWWY